MASPGKAADMPESLENQLRGMILNNVRIDAPPQQSPHYQGNRNSPQRNYLPGSDGRYQGNQSRGAYGPQNPRGRGRGGDRGRGGGHHQAATASITPQEGHYQFHQQHASSPSSGQWRNHMQPNTFQRGPAQKSYGQRPPPSRQLWNPGHAPDRGPDNRWQYLEDLASREVPKVEMSQDELSTKDKLRLDLEAILHSVTVTDKAIEANTISLQSFGSIRSGFATKGSDMDLVIVSQSEDPLQQHLSLHESGLPRMLEKRLLEHGYGARLLTRARVPIIKICEKPPQELLQALREARTTWEGLPDEEKYSLERNPAGKSEKEKASPAEASRSQAANGEPVSETVPGPADEPSKAETEATISADASKEAAPNLPSNGINGQPLPQRDGTNTKDGTPIPALAKQNAQKTQDRSKRTWAREKAKGPLDFPKDGIGIQCDINFFNPLGIHNTQMLRCYALCDPRVRPMILFIKSWAKKRKINHPYSGTLSSYGYVLMVLHFLINITRPPVLPNLQLSAQQMNAPAHKITDWEVRFWRDEAAITQAASTGQLTRNAEPLGALLKSFFQYYAVQQSGFGFRWTQDVLSLRTPGGILSKEQKGWTGAKTETTGNNKEVRHRYLFAVEDPFELDHNVARTVTHNGIVAVRDEFRRAWRILGAVGHGAEPREGGLFDELVED